jgi:methylthioribose-1-phosphate isomerase
MRVSGTPYRSIWPEASGAAVSIIDQTLLPHTFAVRTLHTLADAAEAIRAMHVRGAPLIGVTAAYGIALALQDSATDVALERAGIDLAATRPTAVNLRWALERMRTKLAPVPATARAATAWIEAAVIAEEDVAANRALGAHGLTLLRELHERTGRAVQIMTHCNAGWLATVDYGTALAPIYLAHDAGIPVHVWVSETRPRNQGLLTAWELREHGVPHTLIVDSACGLLLQRGQVDVVLVGADRVTRLGDVCNKVGTYMKALAAREHAISFYAAVPSPTIDWTITDASAIPIEDRAGVEVRRIAGIGADRGRVDVELVPENAAVANPAFDITPAALITGLVTERGVCAPSEATLSAMFPELAKAKVPA